MIEIKNLYKTFANKKVLQGVNLSIKDGEVISIIGGSGTGKSVLLKHMVGLLKPDKGDVLVDGESIVSMDKISIFELQRRFGVVFQGGALFDSMTVGDNVAFGLRRNKNLADEQINAMVKQKLEMVGLHNVEHVLPAELSGGMRKRVAIARAIAYDPEYILYDEPTTGLDPILSDVINDLIISLNKNLNVTSIVITHDMTSAYKISDNIAMLSDGIIIEEGTPDKIKNTKNEIVQKFITGDSR